VPAAESQLPKSALAVEVSGKWKEWWSSPLAPDEWQRPHPVFESLEWRPASRGIETAELRLAGTGEAWRLRVILVRVDPRVVALRPVFGGSDTLRAGTWTVADAQLAALAFNAGQFSGSRPWGWIVRDGRELQPPGAGPLSGVLVVDSDGARLLPAHEIPAARRGRLPLHAFQSYPLLLLPNGKIPDQLKAAGRGVDVVHRDSRLAVGITRDSMLLLALTRFEGLNGVLDILPFGLTTPEMAALMGALGCTTAMLLDGGISGQLSIRDEHGVVRRWPGLRAVPMGMVASPRR
jgi:uncharacterized protein YigE (DUF2233 family)